MRIPGHVFNGVVILEGGAKLPDGTAVTVSCDPPRRQPARKKRRVVLPLVKSPRPGSLNLTNEDIAQALEEEDVANYAPFVQFKGVRSTILS